jgi:dienelactone hydrolase
MLFSGVKGSRIRTEYTRQEARTQNSNCPVGNKFNLAQGMQKDIPWMVYTPGQVQLLAWGDAIWGPIEMKLFDASGAVLWDNQQPQTPTQRTLDLKSGDYRLWIDSTRALMPNGYLLICKLPEAPTQFSTAAPPLDPVRYLQVEAQPQKGWHWPYLLYFPAKTNSTPTPMLIAPNNTGFVSDFFPAHQESARSYLAWLSQKSWFQDRPILVPIFPRPESEPLNYTHALNRQSFLTSTEALKRPDLQLLAMLADARQRLSGAGYQTQDKVFLFGFSASGMFSNRFTLLHPQIVKAAAFGSPGGWPLAPLAAYQQTSLPYPAGIADLAELSGAPLALETYRQVPQFIFLGDQDTNDSVPYEDSFQPEQRDLVFKMFGAAPLERWPKAEQIYHQAAPQAILRLYPGVSHTIPDQAWSDIVQFFDAQP